MKAIAVTYTWVVDVPDEKDAAALAEAVSEYTNTVKDPFANPVSVEVVEEFMTPDEIDDEAAEARLRSYDPEGWANL